MKNISIIVAMTDNGVIGKDNHLLWHLPNDLKYFKATTMGKPIVMGRRTYESIGHSLPGRRNIILSTQKNLVAPGCEVMHSVDQILEMAKEAPEVMITGGGEIYRLLLPWVTRLYITEVHARLEGESTFPPLDLNEWKEISREKYYKDEKHSYDYSFVVLDRL